VNIELNKWYRVLAPRPVVIITTIDESGNINAAPYSFVMPVSGNPPLVAIGSHPERHTLSNIRKTLEFVLNIPVKDLLEKVLICGKKFPPETSELEMAELTAIKAKSVKPPRIEECFAYLECKFECEYACGDHILLIGRIIESEVKDEVLDNEKIDIIRTEPLMHISGKSFTIPKEELIGE